MSSVDIPFSRQQEKKDTLAERVFNSVHRLFEVFTLAQENAYGERPVQEVPGEANGAS